MSFLFKHEFPIHVELINGSYTLEEIKRITFNDETYLYCLGDALLDNSCCGMMGCRYAMVMGKELAMEQDDNGNPESTIAEVTDTNTKETLEKLIRDTEQLDTVNFYIAPESSS